MVVVVVVVVWRRLCFEQNKIQTKQKQKQSKKFRVMGRFRVYLGETLEKLMAGSSLGAHGAE